MPAERIEVTGVKELRAAIRKAGDVGLKHHLRDANKGAAQVVVERALPNVPVRSGRLRRSVRALGSLRVGRVRAGSAAVPYAAAIHWGRKRGNVGSPPGNHPGTNVIGGRPFLWDAAQAASTAVVEVYQAQIQRLLEEIV